MLGLPLRKARKQALIKPLPPELVVAIENIGCIFRSFTQQETGDKIPRPLCMNFLGSRPLYLDDEDKLAQWIGQRYPELNGSQIERAVILIRDRLKTLIQDERLFQQDMRGPRQRSAWMGDVMDFKVL